MALLTTNRYMHTFYNDLVIFAFSDHTIEKKVRILHYYVGQKQTWGRFL